MKRKNKDGNEWKDNPCPWTENLSNPKFNMNPVKIPAEYFVTKPADTEVHAKKKLIKKQPRRGREKIALQILKDTTNILIYLNRH